MEQKLLDLDRSDSGSSNHWRLLTAEYHDNWDLEQRDLLKQLQEKLLVYGKIHGLSHSDYSGTGLSVTDTSTDNLLLNEQKLRELGSPSQRDHRSVLHWIVDRKPVGWGQYDWIFHIDDFVSLSKMDHFVSAILSALKVYYFYSFSANNP